MTVADPTPDNLVTLIRTNVEELSHLDGADKTFDDLDLDSLSMVEIATIIGQTYGVPLGEEEVVDAGDFTALSALVRGRTNA
ncbi:phosphopantetheine-binding protein [Curtobacterium luteum]|uniref:phosphopantetheine-binding protein n=1 Tax=Curtobacterium luteum TaxID=33881 RepID=UPI00380F8D0A